MIFDRLFTRSYQTAIHYLDYSATGRVKPRCVIDAVSRELMLPANAGRGGNSESIRATMVLEKCREEIRSLTGLPNVILTKNCTEALNLAIFGLCKSGTVITSSFEHNSVLRPLYHLRDNGVISLKILDTPIGIITKEMIAKELTEDTQTVVLSAMSNVTGATSDIQSIADFLREKGIKFIVDAAQSAGHIPMIYKGVTAIASSGHKGLNGPQGTGFLALVDGCARLTPILFGGTGIEAESEAQTPIIPEGYESGTQNIPGFAGLGAGIAWTRIHQKETSERVLSLSKKLWDGLMNMSDIRVYSPEGSTVISFNSTKLTPTEAGNYLSNAGIILRSGLHCAPLAHKSLGTLELGGTLRASPGYGSTASDVGVFLTAIRRLNKKL